MGTTITKEQNGEAAKAAAENVSQRFADAGVTSEVVAHSSGKKYEFVRIRCAPDQWRAIAKHLKHEMGLITVQWSLELTIQMDQQKEAGRLLTTCIDGQYKM